jgi:hypothetical protein
MERRSSEPFRMTGSLVWLGKYYPGRYQPHRNAYVNDILYSLSGTNRSTIGAIKHTSSETYHTY